MMKNIISAPILALSGGLFFFGSSQLAASPAYNEQLITANGGTSVTMDHEWAVVGEPATCAIYIYKLDYQTMLWGDGAQNAGTPHSTVKKNCNDSKSRDFGASTSISADLLIVGAPDANVGSIKSAGKVFLFQLMNDTWVEVASDVSARTTLNNIDAQAYAYFGSSVSVSNGLIAVGAPAHDTTNTDAGRAYIFKWNDPDPGLNIITLSDGESANDQFGSAVTTNDPQFLVGAPYADSIYNNDTDVGAAYLYTINASNTADLDQKITIPASAPFAPTPDDHLGVELSLSDSLMLLAGKKSYIVKKDSGGLWAPEFVLPGSNSGDVSQTNGVGAFGIVPTEIDIYPDLASANAANPLTSYYHLQVAPANPGTTAGLDIRLSQDILLINDDTNNRISAMHFPCRYGDKLEANVWNMVSIGCDLAQGTTVEEAFNADIFPELCGDSPPQGTSCGNGTAGEACGVLGEYGTNWLVYGQDGSDYTSSKASGPVADGGTIVQGQSYWIISDSCAKGGDPVYWNVDDSTSASRTPWSAPVGPLPVDISHIGGSYFFELPAPVDPGNGDPHFAKVMVGNPWPRTFDWADVFYQDAGGTLYTLQEAEANDFISSIAYVYNPDSTSGQPYDAVVDTMGFDTLMEPNLGFWVEVLASASSGHKLVIPLNK